MDSMPTQMELLNLKNTAKYMVLSTVCADGSPHTTPVFFAEGRLLYFYWLSTLDAVHSQNIARDPRVSAVIMDTSHEQGTGVALYFKGVASRLPDGQSYFGRDESHEAIGWLCNKSQTLKSREEDLLDPASPRKLFRLEVQQASCNGAVYDEATGLWVDRRMPIDIQVEAGRRYMRLSELGAKKAA